MMQHLLRIWPTEIALRRSSGIAHLHARLDSGSNAWINGRDLLPFAWFLLVDFSLAIAINNATGHARSGTKKYRARLFFLFGQINNFVVITSKPSQCFNWTPIRIQGFNRRLAELWSGFVQWGKPPLSSALPEWPRTCRWLGRVISCINLVRKLMTLTEHCGACCFSSDFKRNKLLERQCVKLNEKFWGIKNSTWNGEGAVVQSWPMARHRDSCRDRRVNVEERLTGC